MTVIFQELFFIDQIISRFERKHNATEAIDEIYEERRMVYIFHQFMKVGDLTAKLNKFNKYLKRSTKSVKYIHIILKFILIGNN